jgi:hypothetical protein
MKSRQLLSVVFSLIMFTGVTAGSAAFAESDDVIDSFDDCVEAGYPVMESYPEKCMTDDGTVFVNDKDDDNYSYDDDKDYVKDYDDDLEDKLDKWCKMTYEEKQKVIKENDKSKDKVADMNRYCTLDETERDAYIDKHERDYKMHDKDMRHMMDSYCDMSDTDKRALIEEHDKPEDHVEQMNKYCSLDETDRMAFIEEHKDEYKDHMTDKMSDKMDMMTDKMHDKMSCECHEGEDGTMNCPMMDENTDMQCSMMDKKHMMKGHDKMMYSDQSHRLKAMIMTKYDVSDERTDEIKMKYREKHGEMTDKHKSDLKENYKKHMSSVKSNMSDERRTMIHDRIAEMKAFKADLRANSADMTDKQKQELREEFIEKAKDMQLAWISPRTQMTAGVDAAEVECREGFSLVFKESNGVAMCLKADTALKMIDRGVVVPSI